MSHAHHAERIYGAIEPGDIEPPEPIPFRPSGDRIVVRQNELEPFTVNGIIKRPDRESDWTAIGVVVAVGPGARNELGERIPIALKVGDQVVYDFRRGREEREVQHICGPRTVVLHEHEVAAVIEEDDVEGLFDDTGRFTRGNQEPDWTARDAAGAPDGGAA